MTRVTIFWRKKWELPPDKTAGQRAYVGLIQANEGASVTSVVVCYPTQQCHTETQTQGGTA